MECKPLVAPLSTNDVLAAELVSCHKIEGEVFAMSMLLEYRKQLNASNVFGNMWTGIEFVTKKTLAAAGDIRSALQPAMTKEFVEWHLGQGWSTKPWPAKLFLNSWTKAFKLPNLGFAGEVSDMMLGETMLRDRAKGMAPMGIGYCICLPQSDGGVKVVGVLSEGVANRLVERDGEVSIVPAEIL